MIYYIYSKNNCQYCAKAKALLTNKGLEYFEMILGEDFTKDDIIAWFPKARTFPQIEIINDDNTHTYVGGFQDLYESLK